jgi:lantibiotic modifying enzyme
VTLNLLADRYWVVGPTGLGLASGVAGIALFLAELDGLVGDARYRQVVEDLMRSLLDDEPPAVADLEGLSIGGYEDLGGLLYLIARLRQLWGGDFGGTALRWLLRAVQHNLAAPRPADVVNGVAGTALVLLACGRRGLPGEVEAALRQTVAALAEAAPAGAGFGLGRSGHTYARAALAAATGDRALAGPAIAALRAWPDAGPAHGWCDGFAGDLLARAAALELPSLGTRTEAAHRDALRGQVERAAATLKDLLAPAGGQQPASADDSLCHGTLGMAEALRTAGTVLGEPSLIATAQATAAATAHRVLAGHVLTGAPNGAWVPGLLTGAAGIGYGLVRAFAPERVPNILLLRGSPVGEA